MLSGYYGFDNLGDELILDVMVQTLLAWGYQPVVLSANPAATRARLGVPAISRTAIRQIWKELGRTEAFISGGGGLFQDITGPMSPVYYGALMQLAWIRNVPIAFFGQGLGPLNTAMGERLTRHALKLSDLIVVRDPESEGMVHQLSRRRALGMGDPVWLLETSPYQSESSPNGVGVSLRPWSTMTESCLTGLAEALSRLPNIQARGVNLIPCHQGADEAPLKALETLLAHYDIPTRWFDASQAIQGIAASDSVVAMRFHALLLAVRLNRPVLALSYDPKVHKLAAQAGVFDLPVEALSDLPQRTFEEGLRLATPHSVAALVAQAQFGFGSLRQWLQGLRADG